MWYSCMELDLHWISLVEAENFRGLDKSVFNVGYKQNNCGGNLGLTLYIGNVRTCLLLLICPNRPKIESFLS